MTTIRRTKTGKKHQAEQAIKQRVNVEKSTARNNMTKIKQYIFHDHQYNLALKNTKLAQ